MKASLIYIICMCILLSCSTVKEDELSVLVVRGGHSYDTPDFEIMSSTLDGIHADLVLNAHFYQMKTADVKAKYDAVLFLNQNKHYPEYSWNKDKYLALSKQGVGMVFLHFTLSSQPEWDEYHDLIGGKWYLKNYTQDESLHSTYFTDMTLDIEVLDKTHPVTKGLDNFILKDAFYGNIYMDPSVHPLLATNHPDVSKVIAWQHSYNQAKIVYIMPGFTKDAYTNPSYKKLISNALHYVGLANN
ncbi:ThuA domain-containing protein [Paraglaciecola sp. L3A3]|uniref:ThuA domain-containing protein n=1 Tax=Paraglaciecola sp. L3A3 TaxID=2686358 RepID=UPI00131EB277|nr:ThuA domain-containing protein [Paraglaciecola sp. L3A3]